MHRQEHAFPLSVFLSSYPLRLPLGKHKCFFQRKEKMEVFLSLSMTKNVFIFTLHLPAPSWHISVCMPLAVRACGRAHPTFRLWGWEVSDKHPYLWAWRFRISVLHLKWVILTFQLWWNCLSSCFSDSAVILKWKPKAPGPRQELFG